MRKLIFALALLSLPTVLTAQSAVFKFKPQYVLSALGTAKINGITGGYNSIGVAERSETFILYAAPVGLVWADSVVKYVATVEALVKAPKIPVFAGVGQHFGFGPDNVYGAIAWWPTKWPLFVHLAAGKKFFALAGGFTVGM